MDNIVPCRISQPLYLQARSGAGDAQMVSLREHIAADPHAGPDLPLVLLTFHPGYSAGSYESRDYFELVTPLLYAACAGQVRLRIFTINHPGQDVPPGSKIDRFQTEQYSIKTQPAMILPALRWLLQHELADETRVNLLSYGHSMGGLALARCGLQQLAEDMARQGRQLQITKVLSAPALILSQDAKRTLPSLNLLHALKHSLGRLPLYDRLAGGLYRTFAPLVHRLSASTYSLNPDDTFLNFRRQDPFLLLEQGRELLQYELDAQEIVDLLDGTHLFLFSGDRMIDSPALLKAAADAQELGAALHVHLINSLHNAERENPQVVAAELQKIITNMLST